MEEAAAGFASPTEAVRRCDRESNTKDARACLVEVLTDEVPFRATLGGKGPEQRTRTWVGRRSERDFHVREITGHESATVSDCAVVLVVFDETLTLDGVPSCQSDDPPRPCTAPALEWNGPKTTWVRRIVSVDEAN